MEATRGLRCMACCWVKECQEALEQIRMGLRVLKGRKEFRAEEIAREIKIHPKLVKFMGMPAGEIWVIGPVPPGTKPTELHRYAVKVKGVKG